MRFCFIIPDLEGGGAQRVVLTFSKILSSRGHDVTLIQFGNRADYSLPPGVRSIVLGRGDLSGGWLNKIIFAFRLRRALAKLKREGDLDFISSSLPFADEVVRLSAASGVWRHVHNTLSQEIASLAKQNKRRAGRRAHRYRKFYSEQKVIAVSQGVADDLARHFGADPAKTQVIYNPFDFDEIDRLSRLDVPGIPTEPYLLHAGRVNTQKRHDVLLDAFKQSGLPHKLVLLNAPSSILTKLIAERELESRVIIAGFQKNPYPWYRRAALFVLSSDFEGFGNVLVESLACGTPAISTNCLSGPSEILSGPLAEFLSPPGDVAALACNMCKAIASPPGIPRETLMRFSADRVTSTLEKIAAESAAAQ